MTEPSPEAIAAYPFDVVESPYDARFNGRQADLRAAFDRGRESRMEATREGLAKQLCHMYGGEGRTLDEMVAPNVQLWQRFLSEADAILASGEIHEARDEREVKAEAIEALAPIHMNTGTAKRLAAELRTEMSKGS